MGDHYEYDYPYNHELALTDRLKQLQKLRNAIQEYENDRWRIISSKVGNGFSAAACKEKATELETEDDEDKEEDIKDQPETGPE
jgi:hypothetical protein